MPQPPKEANVIALWRAWCQLLEEKQEQPLPKRKEESHIQSSEAFFPQRVIWNATIALQQVLMQMDTTISSK